MEGSLKAGSGSIAIQGSAGGGGGGGEGGELVISMAGCRNC